MSRNSIVLPEKERTTISVDKFLMERMSTHVRMTGSNQSNFLTKAIINQMEREGDIAIRSEMEERLGD